MNRILATAIVCLLALPAYAEGSAKAGKKKLSSRIVGMDPLL